MRIQHNVMAMNAYRNYSHNTSALSKNLERLSSGYKINRAGDDAAGLAISEKMRAQITGLEAAQKNVKDGISLVNTAEGAMQEVQDMLNRMVYLAQESANGTYDNEVDRANLQKELVQLNSEIDRIADSANFNGIKLLNGSLGLNTDAFTITTSAASDEAAVTGLFGALPTAGNTKVTNTILHTDETKGVAGSFTLDFSQIVKKADGAAVGSVDVTIGGISTATVTAADKDTDLTGKVIAEKLIGTGGALKDGIVIKADGTMVKADGYTAIKAGDALYTTSSDGANGTLTYTLTKIATKDGTAFDVTLDGTDATLSKLSAIPDSVKDLHKLNFDVDVADNAGDGALTGTENVAATNITATVKAEAGKLANFVIDFDVTKLQDGMELKLGNRTVKVKLGKDSTVQQGTANALLDLSKMEASELAGKKTDVLDKLTAALTGNDYFTVGQTDDNKLSFSEKANGTSGTSTLTAAQQKQLKSVASITALFSASKPAENAKTKIAVTDGSVQEGNTLTIGGKQYVFSDKKTGKDGNTTYVAIKGGAAANLATQLTTDGFTATNNNGTITIDAGAGKDAVEVLGKGLTLQIGDTSDSYNQLSVLISDIHSAKLGTGALNIGTQDGAAAAVDKIKNAINTISSIRGTLGATSNRLDHTANNLSVMRENITDAESSIRDTDIAEEMMSYTKNNILVQSAQAMLAQANQVPQGVLQLLQ